MALGVALILRFLNCFAKVREVLIDDCGHNLHHDQPEQLAARLGEFLAE